ncbi:MAG: hypothetical protein HUK40_21560 [Desulfobacter sp.]|nr:hypothetical protein [Desulfobacter sp.]WDP86018.1 MAG: hypothetical protein HUN05_13510 [Desulfobacter sp.]
MAQKITLSIPDMLHEKLTEWRSSFNFSKMFQEALTDAIQKKEELQKRFSEEFDMPDIVKRLRQEKLDWENNFYNSGKTQGVKWARSAHYENLLYVLHCDHTYEIIGHETFKSYFQKIYEAHDLGKYSVQGGVDHEQKFMDGWFDGVTLFWKEVREQI